MPRKRKRNFNVYRDGKVHVCAKMCDTCIYRPDSPLMNVPIKKEAVQANTAVVCHSTLGEPQQAVCRGFFEFDQTPTLAIARALDVVVFVEPPACKM